MLQKKDNAAIEEQNEKLREIAWTQSHVVRAPLARLMGLVELLKNHELEQHEIDNVISNLGTSAGELDAIISEMIQTATEIKTSL